MAKKHGRGRGVSAGTIVMVSVTLLTLLVGAGIFMRISGDIEGIAIDPRLLTEPLEVLTRYVADTAPQGESQGQQPQAPQGADGGGGDALPFVMATLTPAPTAAPTPEPTLPPSRTLTLTAVGQVSVGSDLRQSALSETGSFSFAPVFSPIEAATRGADLALVTLRSTLGDNADGFDAYNAPSGLAAGLQGAGFTMVNLATDRLFDHGTAGVDATLDILQSQGLFSLGAYRDAQARQSLPLYEVNGVKVAVLSYTSSISNNGRKAAGSAEIEAGTRMLTTAAATADIEAARQAGAEIVIVLAHWGSRADVKASKETRDMATTLAKAGADIILGTNPTSVHEIERQTVVDSGGASREVFIAYSLGNFLIDESRESNDITGMVLSLTIEWNAQTQRAAITDSWYMPTWIMRYRDAAGVSRYRLVPAGSASIPQGMTDSIYANMKKSYQTVVGRIGESNARPRPDL